MKTVFGHLKSVKSFGHHTNILTSLRSKRFRTWGCMGTEERPRNTIFRILHARKLWRVKKKGEGYYSVSVTPSHQWIFTKYFSSNILPYFITLHVKLSQIHGDFDCALCFVTNVTLFRSSIVRYDPLVYYPPPLPYNKFLSCEIRNIL